MRNALYHIGLTILVVAITVATTYLFERRNYRIMVDYVIKLDSINNNRIKMLEEQVDLLESLYILSEQDNNEQD